MVAMEDNELIAEFMGGKYDKDTSFPIHPDDIWLPFHGIVRKEYLNYNKSWDWLMPVVEKIVPPVGWPIDGIKYQTNVMNQLQYAKIEATYKAVVEFIKWYNQQKS